jgi:hypothetical protein
LACDKSPTKPSAPGLTATIAGCTYFLATDGLPASVSASGGTFTLNVTTASTCAWTTSVPPSGLYAAAEVSPAQGVGSGTIQVKVAAHTGIQDRTIQATVATMTVSTVQSAAAPPVAGPNAVVLYSGTAGDTLSFGQAGVLTTDQYKVTAPFVNGHAETVSLDIRSTAPAPQPFPWRVNITMAPRTGTTLAVGLYDNVVRFLGAPGLSPSMSVSFASFACGQAFQGSFEIFDIAFNSNGSLQRLHSKVVHRCLQDPPGSILTLEAWYPSKGPF